MTENTLSTPYGRLRMIGIYEGISYLLLLGIAMPLKYYAGMPEAVRITGSLHGLLFVLYLLALAHATIVYKWSVGKALLALIASLLPFATFYLDKFLLKENK